MEKEKKNKIINIVILFIVTLILSIPLFYSKLNVYQDDGIQHIARAYGTFNSMKENFWTPNVISSFSNNFGYSWNLFYGPLSTYGIILMKLITNNYIVAYKLFTFLCLFLSGLTMYYFMKTVTKIDSIGLLAGILYMQFPYHLTDLYIRNALGEFVSFIFIPVVFLGIYNILWNEKGNKFYLAIGAIGLILTHNLSTLIVAIFSVAYVILKLEKLEEKEVRKYFILNIIFIIFITSFYWVPFLETKFKAEYEVYETGMMATPESTAEAGINVLQLLITKNDGSFVFELGINILIMLVFSVMALKIIDKPLKEHYIFFLISGIITMFMATKYFPWKHLPSFTSYIQFPWRMLMLTSFFISIVCAINMYLVIIKFNTKDVVALTVISLFCTLITFDTSIMGDLGIQDIENIYLGNFSGSEYEVVPGAGKGEYLTKAAYDDKFYLATREDLIYVLSGKAIIEDEKKNGSHYEAKIKTLDADYTIFELPYIYYPGYEVRVDGILVQDFETDNGFLGFAMGRDDDASLEVNYTGTSAMKKSIVLSIISCIVFIIVDIKVTKDLRNKGKDYIIEKVENKDLEEKDG